MLYCYLFKKLVKDERMWSMIVLEKRPLVMVCMVFLGKNPKMIRVFMCVKVINLNSDTSKIM